MRRAPQVCPYKNAYTYSKTAIGMDNTFSFEITEELWHDEAIHYHNHMGHEHTGEILVDEDTGLSGTIEIQILQDGSFNPKEVVVKPGATVMWKNTSDADQIVVSGIPPGSEEEHDEEEEINVGSLEVRPR